MPPVGIVPPSGVDSIDKIEAKNFYEVVNNTVLAPTATNMLYVEMGSEIHIYPRGAETVTASYSVKITDMVYNNDSTDSEIPQESQYILIERVVMQIQSSLGGGQAKSAEIDKDLASKYQLDALIKDNDDKGTTQ